MSIQNTVLGFEPTTFRTRAPSQTTRPGLLLKNLCSRQLIKNEHLITYFRVYRQQLRTAWENSVDVLI